MPENTPYTPTYDEVVTCFSEHASSLAADDNRRGDHGIHFPPEFASYVEAVNGFDRWIAAHDAQVARNAVLRIAGDFQSDAEDAQESEDFDYAYEMARHALDIRQTANLRYPEESPNA